MQLSVSKEREAQLNFMRKRAREREDIQVLPESTSSLRQTDRHVNFFSDIQQGVNAYPWEPA